MRFCVSYVPHDNDLPDALSPFMVAITDEFSMDSLILHGSERGWALDSSWRNKNENRAAVTLLIAVDEQYHAVPGAVFLSANTRAETLEKFLTETKIKLKERARAITEGTAGIEGRTPEQEAKLRQQAEKMMNDEYEPSHFMIDKCLAELHAISIAYPLALIRLCQFHVVQAITRVERDSGDRGSPMRLGVELKAEIIYHFRRLQRCRTHEAWADAEKTFFRNVQRAIRYQEQYDFVYRYFKSNWFTEEWIPTFTDIGLPEGQTRDGTWNTNNYIERSFRTFDAIFLEHRKNKRLDRLVLIIIHDFLPYFKNWPPEDRVIPSHIRRLNDDAHRLWEDGCVVQEPRGTFTVEIPG
ncbi:hypothetical protein K466DRAFT_497090 [Polyporus arcularius HHB13444]|uniref:MULE transposase domain-containing protein n=1 Tax=Polyporus arcularius HHB13444 TaxID=1314778 RepID=A0A5C3P3D6_9APHY|nr:hypothetical protein K466DRAFT_497090 [Polyporus arcularius HHB13444]